MSMRNSVLSTLVEKKEAMNSSKISLSNLAWRNLWIASNKNGLSSKLNNNLISMTCHKFLKFTRITLNFLTFSLLFKQKLMKPELSLKNLDQLMTNWENKEISKRLITDVSNKRNKSWTAISINANLSTKYFKVNSTVTQQNMKLQSRRRCWWSLRKIDSSQR